MMASVLIHEVCHWGVPWGTNCTLGPMPRSGRGDDGSGRRARLLAGRKASCITVHPHQVDCKHYRGR